MEKILLKRKTKKFIQWSFYKSKDDALKNYIYSLFKVKAKLQINNANFQPFRNLHNSSQLHQLHSASQEKFQLFSSFKEKVENFSNTPETDFILKHLHQA